MGHLTQLRTLSITRVSTSHVRDLWTSIKKMIKLTRLAVSTKRHVRSPQLGTPTYLQKFYLSSDKSVKHHDWRPSFAIFSRWSGLTQDPLGSLLQMPSLVYLDLCEPYDGEALVFRFGWFPKLRELHLIRLQRLNSIEISDGAMMNLSELEFRRAVPEGLGFLRMLKYLRADKMPGGFTRAR
uniref:Disease resistance R13L4/SHOC-2-like LRR domain-containing protein n=1 Tax=Oryza brachyantha TaxID=4533 RepID=J3NDK6_ORYBR